MIQKNDIRQVFKRATDFLFNIDAIHINLWVPTNGIFHEAILKRQFNYEKYKQNNTRETKISFQSQSNKKQR